jgi:signal recognition particle receptor subunit beta
MRPSIDSTAADKLARGLEHPKRGATATNYTNMVSKTNYPVIVNKTNLRGIEPNSDIKECLVDGVNVSTIKRKSTTPL